MSQTIDDRVVSLQFDNDQFEQGVDESLKTLNKLKTSLKMDDAAKNLSSISKVADKVDLSGVEKAFDSMQAKVSKKLSVFRLSLASAVGNLFSGLVIDPLKQSITGGIARAENIEKAKFQLEGLGVAWSKIKPDIEHGVNDTAYGLDAAAKAASQLVASGVQVGDSMKKALRGISGVAAMTNTNYEEISPIFTKIAGQGKMMTQELRQLENRGLNTAAAMAKWFNEVNDGKYEVSDSVKASVKELTKGMKISEQTVRDFVHDGEINFELFSAAMDDTFGPHAKDSNNTFTGSLANMKAALSRIGEALREPIMRNAIPAFNALRKMINAVKKALESAGIFDIFSRITALISEKLVKNIDKVTQALSGNLDNFSTFGRGLYNILLTIAQVVQAVAAGFKAAFGKKSDSSEGIKSAAEGFEAFTQKLLPTREALEKIATITYKVINVIRNAKTFLLNAANKIGAVLRPILGKVALYSLGSIGILVYGIAKAFTFLASKMEVVGDLFTKIKNVIFNLIPGISSTRSNLSTMNPVLDSIIEKIRTFATIVKNVFLGVVGVAIAGVTTAFNKLRSIKLSDVVNTVKSFIQSIKSIPVVSTAIDNIRIIFANLQTFFARVGNSLVSFFARFRGESDRTSRSVVQDMTGVQKVIFIVTSAFKMLGAILGGVVLLAFKAFNTVFEFIKNFSLENLINNIKSFIAQVREFGLLNTLSKTFQNVGGIVGKVLTTIVSKLQEFKAQIKNSGSVLDFILDKFEQLGPKISEVKDKIVGGLFGNEVTRGGGESSGLARAIDLIRDKFGQLKETVGGVLKYIRDNGYLTKALMIAWILAVMKTMFNFSKGLTTIADGMTKGTGVFKPFVSFGNVMDNLNKTITYARNPMAALTECVSTWSETYKEAHKKSMAENFAIMMKSMALGIGVLAASLAVLYKVVDNTDKFKTIVTWMGVFVGVMIAVAGGMTILANKMSNVDPSFYSSFAANMIGISLAIGVLAKSVKILSEIPDTALVKGVTALIAIAFMYTAMQTWLSKLEKTGKMLTFQLKGILKTGLKIAAAASSFLLFAGGLLMMAEALRRFKELDLFNDTDGLYSILEGITLIGVLFAGVVVAAKYSPGAAKGLLAIGGTMALLGFCAVQITVACLLMKLVQLPDIGKMLLTFGGIILLFKFLTWGLNTEKVTKSIIGIGVAFTLLGNTLLKVILAAKLMEYIDPDGLTLALTTLAALVGMMTILILATSKLKNGQTWKPIVAMLAGMGLIMGLLITLSVMCANPTVFFDILKATGILALLMVSYAEVLKGAGKINSSKGAPMILAMLAGLGAMIGALYLLMPMVSNFGDFMKLVGITAVLELALYGLVKITEGFLKFAKDNKLGNGKWVVKALIALGAMVVAFGAIAAILVLTSKNASWYEVATIAVALSAALVGLCFAAKLIIESTKKLKWKELGKAAATMGVMIVAIGILSAIFVAITKFIEGTSMETILATIVTMGAMLGLMALFGKTIKTINKIKTKDLLTAAKVMGFLLIAMVAVGAVMAALTFLVRDPASALASSQVVALVVGELILLAALMGKLSKEIKKVSKAVPALLMMVGVFAAVGLVIAGLNFISGDAKSAFLHSQIVSLVLAELIGLSALLGLVSTTAAKAIAAMPALLLMTGIFAVVGLVLVAVNFISGDAKTTLANSQVISLVLVELVALTAILGLITGFAAPAIAAMPALLLMTLVYGAVGLVLLAINLISGDAKTSLANSQIVALVLTELIALTALVGLLSPLAVSALAGLPALLAMTLVYGALGAVIAIISIVSKDSKSALANSQITSLVLTELIALTALLGILAPLAVTATVALIPLIGMVAVFGALGIIIGIIGSMEFGEDIKTKTDTLTSVLWSLVGMMAVLGLLSAGAVGELAGAAALFIVAQALVPLANGLNALGTVDYNTISEGLKVIAAGLVVLIAAGVAGVIAGAGFLVLAVGIAAVGVACIVAGAGVMILSMALAMLIQTVVIFAQSIIESAQSAIDGFKEKLEKFKELPADIMQAIIDGLANVKEQFKNAGKQMGEAIINGFREGAGWHSPPEPLVKFFEDCGVAVNENADGITDMFEGTGNDWGSALEKALGAKFEDIKNFDTSAIGDLLGGNLGDSIFSSAIPGITDTKNMLAMLGLAADDLQSKLAALDRQYNSGAMGATVYEFEVKKAVEASKDLSLSTEDLTKALGGLGDGAKGAGNQMKDFQSSLQETLTSQMNIFQKFEAKQAMSKEELLGNMRSQIEGMANWAAQMQQLATLGIDQGLYQKLAEMGPQGAEYVGAFASMTAEEMAEANTLWAQSLVLPGQTAAMVTGSWKGISEDMIDGLAAGWTDNEGVFHDAALRTSSNLQDDWKSENGIHSPSTVYAGFARWMVWGLIEGLEKNRKFAVEAIERLSKAMMDTMKKALSAENFAEIGTNIVNGLTEGLKDEDALKELNKATAAVMDKVKKTATGPEEKGGAEIESPSKVFYKYGRFIDLGLANGIRDYGDVVVASVGDMGDDTISAMKYTIANIAAMINDEMEDPVITPVLDLTNVQNGVKKLNTVLSTNRALGVASSVNGNLQNGQSNIGGTTFIQNNYSPKALSRAEIYRQTSNQFARFRAQANY